MIMTISERMGADKIDVKGFAEKEGGEIYIEFPDSHIEIELDLKEAIKLNCLLNSAIQDICYIREESKKHEDGN